MRLGGLINTCGTQEALNAAMRSDEGGPALMKSLTIGLGEGLNSGPHGGALFAQPRLADGRMMDDVAGYAATLIVDASLAAEVKAPQGLTVLTTKDLPGASELLANLQVVAVVVRPDRYILATAANAGEIPALIEAASRLSGLPGPTSSMPNQEKISA